MTEQQRLAIRAMVEEIGSPPMQDIHFDAWFYPNQSPQVFGLQTYEQSIIRKYVELKGGENPSLALIEPMNAFMAAIMDDDLAQAQKA